MTKSNTYKAGRHFLQVPGPTNFPDRILRAMDRPAMDHRGPQFSELSKRILDRVKIIFKSTDPVIIWPSSGTGAMEASIVNTLSEGDKVLMFETGHFATEWCQAARRYKVNGDFVPGAWSHGESPKILEEKLDICKKTKWINHKIWRSGIPYGNKMCGIRITSSHRMWRNLV